MADSRGMDQGSPAACRPAGTRRVAARRLVAWLWAALYRPLAEDPGRAAYWVRHVRHGVVLSEVAAIAVLCYEVLAPGRQHAAAIAAIAAGVVLLTPTVLLLPVAEFVRDVRGTLLFYGWSAAVTVVITVGARLDGGAQSPLCSVLYLTLVFVAVAYPPFGVLATGTVMTAAYLLVIAAPHLTPSVLFIAVVMGAFTMICSLSSANSWSSYDRQVLMLRTHETLAATDPLTGCPNRRAFLERLGRAIDDAAAGLPSVVCLIDLDGFKAVNDRAGHAAGDAALKAVTSALNGAVRETDTVARLGGDEFAVLARVSPSLPPAVLAERLRAAVAEAGRDCGVTASVGVAMVDPADDGDLLLHRADAAMYRSKTSGGDRVTTPVG